MTWLTWSLLSALFAAATAILAKIGVKGVDANVATAVRTCVVLVFTWLLVYLARQPSAFQPFSKKDLAISGSLRTRNGSFVAVLFPCLAGWPGLWRSSFSSALCSWGSG